MKADLLIVSADDFPIHISRTLENFGFNCYFTRGGIKTKETLKSQNIDSIVWLYWGHEKELAMDLLKIFNRHKNIPVVFITQSYDELDFAEDIKGLFDNVDVNDDVEDILLTVENACSQQFESTKETPPSNPPEIDFKNAVSLAIEEEAKTQKEDPEENQNPFENVSLWNAVDNNEKRLLAGDSTVKKQPLFSRIRKKFK